MAEVAIIGAGLVGLSTAYLLQKSGHRVTVIDRRPAPGLETSFANGGLMTPTMCQPWNQPGIHRALLKSIGHSNSPVLLRASALPSMIRWGIAFLRESKPSNYIRNTRSNFRLAQSSLKVLDDWMPSVRDAVPVNPTGSLNIYRKIEELQAGAEELAVLEDEGLTQQKLTPQECVELEPMLGPIEGKLAGGIYFPNDRSGDAHQFCNRIASDIQAAGGEFLFDTKVVGWNFDGKRVLGARTATQEVAADRFVIAAGSYSPKLARMLAIDLPIYPAKGYSLTFDCEKLPILPRVPVVDASLHAAISTINGRLRVAGTAEFAGFNNQIHPARIRNLESLLQQIYPDLAAHSLDEPRQPWTGLRPMSCDGVPIVSNSHIGNVYLNTGHGHLGWTLAAGSGQLLAQIISGQVPALDPFPYSLNRFRN